MLCVLSGNHEAFAAPPCAKRYHLSYRAPSACPSLHEARCAISRYFYCADPNVPECDERHPPDCSAVETEAGWWYAENTRFAGILSVTIVPDEGAFVGGYILADADGAPACSSSPAAGAPQRYRSPDCRATLSDLAFAIVEAIRIECNTGLASDESASHAPPSPPPPSAPAKQPQRATHTPEPESLGPRVELGAEASPDWRIGPSTAWGGSLSLGYWLATQPWSLRLGAGYWGGSWRDPRAEQLALSLVALALEVCPRISVIGDWLHVPLCIAADGGIRLVTFDAGGGVDSDRQFGWWSSVVAAPRVRAQSTSLFFEAGGGIAFPLVRGVVRGRRNSAADSPVLYETPVVAPVARLGFGARF